MVRLSVAVRPPADVVARLVAWERPDLAGVTWSVPEQWIVKVRPLGHVAVELVAPLLDALDAELDGAPLAECVLGPRTERLGGQWLGAPVSGLDELGAAVFDATRELVPVTHPQPFRADVVLARGKVPRELADLPVDAAWTATELLLVADRSAPGRPRMEDLGGVSLGRRRPGRARAGRSDVAHDVAPNVTSGRSATASSSTASIASPETLRSLPITS